MYNNVTIFLGLTNLFTVKDKTKYWSEHTYLLARRSSASPARQQLLPEVEPWKIVVNECDKNLIFD